ncbi:hypothetical protein F7U66_18675 [Vibrio parahaemolyticus]|nr:hypothetical protein [Vibrio parahaemolyticus]
MRNEIIELLESGITVNTGGQLVGFRMDHQDYQDADDHGGVYVTSSELHAVDGMHSSLEGYYDILEVIDMVLDMVGNTDFVLGLVYTIDKYKVFVESKVVSQYILHNQERTSDSEFNVHELLQFALLVHGDIEKVKEIFPQVPDKYLPYYAKSCVSFSLV